MGTLHQRLPDASSSVPGAPATSGAGAFARLLGQMLGVRLAVLSEISAAVVARRSGIRRLDLRALTYIAQLEPLPTGQLVCLLGLSPGGVNSILNRLEDDGLIRRDRNLRDRRQISLCLADDQVLDRIFPDEMVAALQSVLERKDPQEVERFVAMLSACVEAIHRRFSL